MRMILEFPDSELSTLVTSAIEKALNKKESEDINLFTINEVSKKLKKAHATIKKLVQNGIIKTTRDGLITEIELNNYLQNC